MILVCDGEELEIWPGWVGELNRIGVNWWDV